MRTINKINNLYKTKEGDILAAQELLPIVKKYNNFDQPKILEIGCGYGRNLPALASILRSKVTGCDISATELEKAKEKIKEYQINNAALVLQKEPNQLPFDKNSFDFVVIWQVLEHILSKKDKAAFLNEAVRVCKNNGCILIETPNYLFPFDYHDNNLPLVHWLLPDKYRQLITTKLRKETFPPSQYTTIFSLRKIFSQSPYLKTFKQKTRIYFEENYLGIFKHLGGTRVKFKIIFFTMYFPIYCFLRLFGLPADMFTPSLRVVFEIEK